MMTDNPSPLKDSAAEPGQRRIVRSFVRRAGRLTRAQERALADLWPQFGIDYSPGVLDLDAVFGRRAPRIMEIGFGNGDSLTHMAQGHPELDFLGVEVHDPGVGHCLLLLEKHGLSNVRLIRHDAVEVLREQIADGSLQRVNLFFPDPWPKKRHHKRRLIQPGFVHLVAAKLGASGLFHIATDWQPYAEHIDAVLAAEPAFTPSGRLAPDRASTRFEQRGERLGHAVFESVWERSTRPGG